MWLCESVYGGGRCPNGFHIVGLALNRINSSDVSWYAFHHNRRMFKFAIAIFLLRMSAMIL